MSCIEVWTSRCIIFQTFSKLREIACKNVHVISKPLCITFSNFKKRSRLLVRPNSAALCLNICATRSLMYVALTTYGVGCRLDENLRFYTNKLCKICIQILLKCHGIFMNISRHNFATIFFYKMYIKMSWNCYDIFDFDKKKSINISWKFHKICMKLLFFF